MKRLSKILLALAGLIVIILVAGFVYLNHIKKAAIPDYNKNVVLEGLGSEVTVFRDKYAIPHVYASNEKDLYKAVGYLMAQDRLWQMDVLRRVTEGRLSEIFGARLVNTDLLMRALRIQEKSEKILKTSDPAVVSALEEFADGVNQYIAKNPLPPEFRILGYRPEPWKPIQSVNLVGYMSWDLSAGWDTELLLSQLSKYLSKNQWTELISDMSNQKTAVFPEFKLSDIDPAKTLLSAAENLEDMGLVIFHGSNNWAVSGKKSKTGKPLLANDMHLGLSIPGIWYEMHQSVPGKLDVTGVVLPGQPFIIDGHNDSVAWGMTNVEVDNLDFYEETLNRDSTQYLFDNAWKNLLISNETIKIKGGKEVKRVLRFTHRGPIVNEFQASSGRPVSIRWIGNDMSNEIMAVYLLDRAHNWTEFRNAAKLFTSISQNIVYADMAGNIGLQASAGIPIRKGDGSQIYPGDTDEYDWKGLVPFSQLPFEYNPDRGYVSSANNKTVPDNYPYFISHWFAMPDRIDRIREMLDEKDKMGVQDFQAMQGDVHSKLVERIMPEFLPALQHHPGWSETEKAAVGKLSSWNGTLTRDSQAASVFEVLYRKVCEDLIKDDLPNNLYEKLRGNRTILENLLLNILRDKTSAWIDDKSTPQKESFDDIVVRAFKETVVELTGRSGENTDNWEWGKIHTLTLGHPLGSVAILDKLFNLNRGPFDLPGSFHTICAYSYSYYDLYKVGHGPSQRHVYDLSDWDASTTVIPTGTSGIPASKFYCDQTNLYINNLYHDDPFSQEDVKKEALFEMKFQPE